MSKASTGGAAAGGGAVYGLGFFGAAFYYFTAADTFWEFALAIFKAMVWPAIFVYEIFKVFYGG